MPIVPPATSSPYPTISLVMNVARVRVNDMINDVNGDLLTNVAPYSQTYLTAAWRWYQRKCYALGVETPIAELTLYGLPVRASDDVANQSYITWEGCSDGVYQYDTPAFPQSMIQPLSVWRRESGTSANFCLMTQAKDGLPRFLAPNVYDWREDGLYHYGSTYAQDMLFRYQKSRPDLDITQPDSQVPMMDSEEALGLYVGYQFADARGSQQASNLLARAEAAVSEGAAQRTSRRKQRGSTRRIPYGRRGYGSSTNFLPINS